MKMFKNANFWVDYVPQSHCAVDKLIRMLGTHREKPNSMHPNESTPMHPT